jgi:hypothetical protein
MMSKNVNSRHIRLSGRHIHALLDKYPVEVSNISLSGALLVADEPFTVGQTERLALKRGSKGLQLQVRIVRVEPAERGRWQTAVLFLNVSHDVRRMIPTLAA